MHTPLLLEFPALCPPHGEPPPPTHSLCSEASAVSSKDKTVSEIGEIEAAQAWALGESGRGGRLYVRLPRKRAQDGVGDLCLHSRQLPRVWLG